MARDAGFSLLEAIVALAVLGGVGATALTLFSSNDERTARALGRFRASVAAESLVNRVGLDVALVPQARKGAFRDGSKWSLDVAPYAERIGAGEQLFPDLLTVRVRVTPARAGSPPIALSTLRPAEPRP